MTVLADAVTKIRKVVGPMGSVSSRVADILVDWSFALNWVSLVLVAITVFLGGLTIIAGKISSDRQETKIAVLEKAASDAETARLSMETSLEETRGRTIEAIQRVVGLRDELTGRDLRLTAFSGATLRQYRGMRFRVIHAKGVEPRRLADELAKRLEECGWIQVDANEAEVPFPVGIMISTRPEGRIKSEKTTPATIALEEELARLHLKAWRSVAELPDATDFAVIQVGQSELLIPQPTEKPDVGRDYIAALHRAVPTALTQELSAPSPPHPFRDVKRADPLPVIDVEKVAERLKAAVYEGLTVRLSYAKESEQLADQIAAAFGKAGWKVIIDEYVTPEVGVVYRMHPPIGGADDQYQRAGSIIAGAIRGRGIPVRHVNSGSLSARTAEIPVVVGIIPADPTGYR